MAIRWLNKFRKLEEVTDPDCTRLARRLDFKDAVFLGLGSMIGAGIFAAAGPAAHAAGAGLLVGVFFAGCLAFLNATSMAQLAALYPESGGAYAYGRQRLGAVWGFLAGWGFVVGKLASCTAMALTFGYYASPEHARAIAVTAVAVLTAVNYLGVKKTAFVTKLLVICVLLSLTVVVFAALAGGAAEASRLSGWTDRGGVAGIFEATGMIFFAFAGYARIATLGEEVIQPSKTIPRAMLAALFLTFVIYLFVLTTALVSVDLNALVDAKAPLVLAVESGSYHTWGFLVRIGACLASLSVLLSLMAGIGRTVFAMAANRDLPHFLSAVHARHKIPHRAEIMVGGLIIAILCLADLRSAIGFSSFAILIYYAIANIATCTLPKEQKRWPRWMPMAGFLACLIIAFSLPKVSVIGGLALFAIGFVFYKKIHGVN